MVFNVLNAVLAPYMLAIVLSDALHLARVDVFCGPALGYRRYVGAVYRLTPRLWSPYLRSVHP